MTMIDLGFTVAGANYLIKAHISTDAFVAQVGNNIVDGAYLRLCILDCLSQLSALS